MPCYDLNGNTVPGTPQTCDSLGGVWRDGVPQSLQQPEETVVAPGMNYNGKPIEGKSKYPNLFENGGGMATNTNKPQATYSTTDIDNSLKGINQFFHSAIDKEFDGGFMGFNPINNIAHNSISKHMSSYSNPNQVTPAMIAGTREMIRDKAGSRLGPQKTQYILDMFNRYAKKLEDYQNASGNIPVTSPTSKRPYDITDANMGYVTKTQLPSKVQEQSVDTDKLNTVVEWIKNNPIEAASYGLMAGSGAGPVISAGGVIYKLSKNSKWLKKAYDYAINKGFKRDIHQISKGTGKTPKGEKIPLTKNKQVTDKSKPWTMEKGSDGKMHRKYKTKTTQEVQLDRLGNPIPKSFGKEFSPGKIAGWTGAGLYGAGQMDMGGDSNLVKSGIPPGTPGGIPPGTPRGTPRGTSRGTPPPPESSSLWDDITGGLGAAKDWAYTQQGNAPWDNRLFRLGELMSYSMNPSNQRPDNPTNRWNDAANVASKNQAAIAKARAKGKTNIFSKAGNTQHERALREKVAIKMGKGEWLDTDPTKEELDAQVAEAAIAINYLITDMQMSPAEAEELVLNSIK